MLSLFTGEIDVEQAIIGQPLAVSSMTPIVDVLVLMTQARASCAITDGDETLENLLNESRSSCVLIVEGNRLLGIFTERDAIRLGAAGTPLTGMTISHVMTSSVITLRHSECIDLFTPLNLLHHYQIRHLPIIDEFGQVIGLLTQEILQQLLCPVDLFRVRPVSEVMISEVVSAAPNSSVLTLAQLMAQYQLGSVVIVEEKVVQKDDRTESLTIPVGMVTERDIVQFQALELNFEQIQAHSVMSTPVFSIRPEASLWSVQLLMQTHRVGRVVVTGKQGELSGIVTQRTLLQALNPAEIYKQLVGVEQKVSRLESEKLELLQRRTAELEALVQERTAALQAQAEREKLLSGIANRIRASLDLQDTMNTIVTEVRQWLACDRVLIYQFQPDWTGVVLAESVVTGGQSFLSHAVNDPCFAPDWVEPYSKGRVRIVNDIWTDMMASCHRDFLLNLQVRAKVLLPIIVNDRLWGLMLVAQNDGPRSWQPDEIDLIKQIAIQAAIAIQQAELYQKAQLEIQERLRAETALRESEELYRATLSNISDAIFVATDQGQITLIGPNVQILFGYTVDEVKQMGTIDQLLGTALFDLQQLIDCGEIVNIEREILDNQGNSHTVLINLKRVQIGPGTVLYSCRDISDRKQAEITLLQSERRYASLAEAAPVGIFRTDIQGRCLYVNDRWCQISGLEPRKAFGNGWKQGLHPDDRDKIAAEWQESVQESRPFRLEYRFQCPDRSITWVSGQSVAERGEDGRIIGYIGTITDITARKRAEEQLYQLNAELERRVEQRTIELAQTNQFLTLVMDSIPQRIFWKDRDSRIIGCNRLFAKDAGLTPEDAIGRGLGEFSETPEESEHYRNCDQRVITTGTAELQILETVHKPDGSWIWVETNKVPLRDANGDIIGVLATYDDITDRKTAELALQESQHLISRIMEASPDILYIYDLQDRYIVYVNQEITRLLGYEPQEIQAMGNNVWKYLLHPEDLPNFIAHHHRFLAASDTDIWEIEYRMRDREGHWRWFISRDTIFNHDLQDCPKQIIGAASDMTERKKVDAELRQTNAELARATRLKDEFLANMSHELRTPLNAILGMAEGLQDGVFGRLNDRQEHALSTLERSGKHLLELINDILDLAKIEAGKLELQLEPVAIRYLCESSLTFVRQQAIQKQIQLQTDIPSNLADIHVDERRLRQVLINLLNNAVKFTPAGGSVTLKVWYEQTDPPEDHEVTTAPFFESFPHFPPIRSTSYLYFSVLDTGIGIAQADLSRLFQSFVQIDSSLNRQQSGTGLGLALIKQIIELHHGWVKVTSEIGKGSCFTVCLPYLDENGSVKNLNVSPAQAIGQADVGILAPSIPAKILLAEDNEANINTISSYLESRGYQVEIAKDGQQAIDMVKKEIPALILMDIQMSGMDGLETIRQLRLEPALAKVPIVALTALSMVDDRDRCLEAGATDYMSKPVRLKQLTTLIQQLLQG